VRASFDDGRPAGFCPCFRGCPAANPTKHDLCERAARGLVIRVQPDEKIVAGKTDGPVRLTVTPEVRLFPGKPPIIPRFSKMFATVVESNKPDGSRDARAIA
jgi:hypothetical protein